MAYVYNTVYTIESSPSISTFIPYCNAPISVDYQPRHIQEIYYAPEPPPQIQVVRSRLPDPPADVIERVVVVPQPKQYVYQVVEVPTKPPPIIRQRVVHQSPSSPLCGGTYQVAVAPNSKSSSTPVTIQASPSYVQQSPMMAASPQIITI